jgi:hypothetical protein
MERPYSEAADVSSPIDLENTASHALRVESDWQSPGHGAKSPSLGGAHVATVAIEAPPRISIGRKHGAPRSDASSEEILDTVQRQTLRDCTMDTRQNNTLEMCCLLAVPLSLLLTVLLAGFILSCTNDAGLADRLDSRCIGRTLTG